VGSIEVVEVFPLAELGLEIDVALVRQELVKFLLIGAVGTFDPAVELRSSALYIGVAGALIFDVPMELGLELTAVVGPDFLDAEWQLFDDVIDKDDRVGLSMFVVDFERLDTCFVIDGGISVATDFLTTLADEGEEFDRHLLVVTLCVDFVHAGSKRQSTSTVAAQNACHTSVGYFDTVISRSSPVIGSIFLVAYRQYERCPASPFSPAGDCRRVTCGRCSQMDQCSKQSNGLRTEKEDAP
jgi:hypothetical protein